MWLMRFNPEWLYETSRNVDFSSEPKAGQLRYEGRRGGGEPGQAGIASPPTAEAGRGLAFGGSVELPKRNEWPPQNPLEAESWLCRRSNRSDGPLLRPLRPRRSVLQSLQPEHRTGRQAPGRARLRSQPGTHSSSTGAVRNKNVEFLSTVIPWRPFRCSAATAGVNYLRLRSIAEGIDGAGLSIESVDASISE